jgi:hypothetical protein
MANRAGPDYSRAAFFTRAYIVMVTGQQSWLRTGPPSQPKGLGVPVRCSPRQSANHEPISSSGWQFGTKFSFISTYQRSIALSLCIIDLLYQIVPKSEVVNTSCAAGKAKRDAGRPSCKYILVMIST